LLGSKPETIPFEPWSEFEKLYSNKPFPTAFSNDELIDEAEMNEVLERKKRETMKGPLFGNLNKMDEAIKKVEEIPKNSKFHGASLLQENK
jgi:hypothetical protein